MSLAVSAGPAAPATPAWPRAPVGPRVDDGLADLLARRAPVGGTARDRTALLCERHGLDPTSVPTIHVTGTRGKTSTAWLVDALLRVAGLTTARFTSPHLHGPGERLVVDGVALSDGAVAQRWQRLRPLAATLDRSGHPTSFFDLVTTLFVELVVEVAPDVAIVEVGRGGRDDATNVVAADVAVFAPIGGDHPDLGATPLALARTKFGIATHGNRRPDGPRLVTATQRPDVAGFLACAAAARGWPLHWADARDLVTGNGRHRLRVVGVDRSDREVVLPDRGRHHAENAVLALAAAEAFLGGRLDPATVAAGLAHTAVPGRLETRVRHGVTVRLDGAHDPLAAAALGRSLPTAGAPRVLVLGAAAGKDVDGIVGALAPACDAVVATTIPSPGGLHPGEIAAAATRHGLDVACAPDPDAALAVAVDRAGRTGEVLVAGSLHLVGHLRHRCIPT